MKELKALNKRTAPKSVAPEKIIQLDEAKEILKKNKSSETLSQEELENIEEKLQ